MTDGLYGVLAMNVVHPAVIGNAGSMVADAVMTLGRNLTPSEHRLLVEHYRLLVTANLAGGGWDEDAHPRDDKGRFGSGGGGSSTEDVRSKRLREAGAKVVDVAKGAGAKAKGLLGALSGAIHDTAAMKFISGKASEVSNFVKEAWPHLPAVMRVPLEKAGKGALWLEHKLEAGYSGVHDIARGIAAETAPKTVTELKEGGGTSTRPTRPEEHEDHAKGVAFALKVGDEAARWVTNIPIAHSGIEAGMHATGVAHLLGAFGGPVAFLGAKIGYYMPVASMAYVGAKMAGTLAKGGNPFKLIANARVRAAEYSRERGDHGHTGGITEGLATHAANDSGLKAFAVRFSKWLWTVPAANKDWATALFAAALDQQGPDKDKDAALTATMKMYSAHPRPEGV